jgi:hypothetical protein
MSASPFLRSFLPLLWLVIVYVTKVESLVALNVYTVYGILEKNESAIRNKRGDIYSVLRAKT